MSKFTDNLWQDLVREHGETLVQAERPEAGRAGRAGRATILRRPRVIAGGSLGLAGVGAALVLALGGTRARRSRIRMAHGRAAVPGTRPVPRGAVGTTGEDPRGTNGTEVIASGQSAGNTAEGTYHLASCFTSKASGTGNSGAG